MITRLQTLAKDYTRDKPGLLSMQGILVDFGSVVVQFFAPSEATTMSGSEGIEIPSPSSVPGVSGSVEEDTSSGNEGSIQEPVVIDIETMLLTAQAYRARVLHELKSVEEDISLMEQEWKTIQERSRGTNILTFRRKHGAGN